MLTRRRLSGELPPALVVLVVFSSGEPLSLPMEERRIGSPKLLESLRPGSWTSLPLWKMPRRSCQSFAEDMMLMLFVWLVEWLEEYFRYCKGSTGR